MKYSYIHNIYESFQIEKVDVTPQQKSWDKAHFFAAESFASQSKCAKKHPPASERQNVYMKDEAKCYIYEEKSLHSPAMKI